MAKIILSNVEVNRIFWEGKGASVVEKYTSRGEQKQTRYALFFNEPHGLAEGDVVSAEGLLSASIDEYTKQDGTIGRSVALKLNNPQLIGEKGRVPAPEKTQEAAIMETWPTATIGQAQDVADESAPF